jgi:nitrous oxidase accessory protein
MTRVRGIAAALIAAALVACSTQLPLWTMTMVAPQYRNGLRLHAYGTGMTGDVRELNILNHYIGMPPLEAPALETALFPLAIAMLVILCLISPVHRWLHRIALTVMALTPIAVLADLQYRLYVFGHTLNPTAPFRPGAFTPLVVGRSHVGNFSTTGMPDWGLACLAAAAVVLWIVPRSGGRAAGARKDQRGGHAAIAAAIAALMIVTLGGSSRADGSLQARIDAAPRGSTLVVPPGVYAGPITIHGPLTVVGEPGADIAGNGIGSVVTIDGDDAVFRGFIVRNSGRNVTEEAAGIRVSGNRHRIEGNDIRDVYFGIHLEGGRGAVVQDNTIAPGSTHGARAGHGISVWHVTGTELRRNRITDARDGIYLSFTDHVTVAENIVTNSRYALHSMYSRDIRFEDNDVSGNRLGAALMMSDHLVLAGNRIRDHRTGAAAYGVLLKDIANLVAEDNRILSNRIGVYAEGVAPGRGDTAILRNNVIAANEVGLALQSTAALTVTANRFAENLTDVRPLGRELSSAMRWSDNGRGNSWGDYRGYDGDGDGIGDVPHRVESAMEDLIERNPLALAFLYTPAHTALESGARMFPLYRRAPVLVDDRPLMRPPDGGAR